MALPRKLAVLVCVGTLSASGSARAQSRVAPAPEPVQVATKDGVQLAMTYFPAARRRAPADAKQTTPVVLLHDHKETRAVFNSLAQQLQAPPEGDEMRPAFAALTVDLRGHGDSTARVLRDGTRGDLDAARLGKADYLAMVAFDMEAVRSFLVAKNDAGELNLNKLCIVGAGMGASVGANWAARDWAAPPLAVGKQGQDVKALVLISPRWSYQGLTYQAPMRFRALKQQLSWMIIYGADDREVQSDAVRIKKQLERFHSDDGDTSLQVVAWPNSKLQGTTLLRQAGETLDAKIIDFLSTEVAEKQLPWSARLDRIP